MLFRKEPPVEPPTFDLDKAEIELAIGRLKSERSKLEVTITAAKRAKVELERAISESRKSNQIGRGR